MFEIAERFERVVDEAADRHAQAWSLTASAMVQSHHGRYREALAVLDRTVAVCREIPEHRALAHALGLRATNLRRLDRLEEAERCAIEAVQLLTKHRLTGIFSTVPLIEHAEVALALLQRSPKPTRATLHKTGRAIRRALRQGRRVHDDGAVDSQRIAGEFKFLCGDVAGAHEAWSCGLQSSEAFETVPARARLLAARGRLCRQPRDVQEARRLYEQCECWQERREPAGESLASNARGGPASRNR
jgi:tetratricopeptide (TPR) repeat protein